MSRRPGIGADWAKVYSSDVFRDDFVVINGVRCKPPKFYDERFELDFPKDFKKLRAKRLESARAKADDATPSRLKVRERVTLARVGLYRRD